MRPIMTVVAAAALAASTAACSQSAPEPENESVAEAMPETPDLSDTVADERAAGVETPGVTTEETPQPETAPAY